MYVSAYAPFRLNFKLVWVCINGLPGDWSVVRL